MAAACDLIIPGLAGKMEASLAGLDGNRSSSVSMSYGASLPAGLALPFSKQKQRGWDIHDGRSYKSSLEHSIIPSTSSSISTSTSSSSSSASSSTTTKRPDCQSDLPPPAGSSLDVKDTKSTSIPLSTYKASVFEAAFPVSSLASTSASLPHPEYEYYSSCSIPPSLLSDSESDASSIFSVTSGSSNHHINTHGTATSTADSFLYPYIPDNERHRLKEFWYLTSDIHQDDSLANHLQSLLQNIQDLLDFDLAMLQFIDSDRASSLTPAGWASTCYPRRETGCAHTMLLKPGTVLNVADFLSDWRFKKNPQIEAAQMRTYAGTPLCYTTEDTGQTVNLGSLCVINFSERPILTPKQQKCLTRFAGVVMHAIKDRTRLRREAQQTRRQVLLDELSKLSTKPSEIVAAALATLGETLDAHASFVKSENGALPLRGVDNVNYRDFRQSMWDNEDVLEDFVQMHNHEPSTGWASRSTVRAIAVPLVNLDSHYLTVETNYPRKVFDDADVLFVQSCGLLIATSIQEGLLRQALEAKTSFLRNVQHAFRTSLNGILSATDMLLGDQRAVAHGNPGHRDAVQQLVSATSPLDLLRIIESSGRGLLTVINHLIDLDSQNVTVRHEVCDLHELEEEVLDAVVQYSANDKMKDVNILSESHLDGIIGDCVVNDKVLIRQILIALVQNAVDATPDGGKVTITFRLELLSSHDYDLVIDVSDTGCGISSADQERIFNPFEKINTFTQNVGLGLTFAAQYANSVGGSIQLLSSSSESGTLFRFRLPQPILASNWKGYRNMRKVPKHWKYYLLYEGDRPTAQQVHYGDALRRSGLKQAGKLQEASIVIGWVSVLRHAATQCLSDNQVLLMLAREDDHHSRPVYHTNEARTVLARFPWTRRRLVETLLAVSTLLPETPFDVARSPKTPVQELAQMLFDRPPAKVQALLVDDNAMNLNILQAYCRKRNYKHTSALDGRQAYEAYVTATEAGRPPTICLLDLQMPVCDGIECAKLVRAYEKQASLRRCPIIIVTAQSGEQDRRNALDADTDGFYVKPLRISTLDDIMSRFSLH